MHSKYLNTAVAKDLVSDKCEIKLLLEIALVYQKKYVNTYKKWISNIKVIIGHILYIIYIIYTVYNLCIEKMYPGIHCHGSVAVKVVHVILF